MTRARIGVATGTVTAALMAAAALACAVRSSTVPFVIEGRVVDGLTRLPFAGTKMQIVGTSHAVLAGEDGRFVLRGQALPGRYRVRAELVGYQTLMRDVRLGGSARVRLGEMALDVDWRDLGIVIPACRTQREPPADTVTWQVEERGDSREG